MQYDTLQKTLELGVTIYQGYTWCGCNELGDTVLQRYMSQYFIRTTWVVRFAIAAIIKFKKMKGKSKEM